MQVVVWFDKTTDFSFKASFGTAHEPDVFKDFFKVNTCCRIDRSTKNLQPSLLPLWPTCVTYFPQNWITNSGKWITPKQVPLHWRGRDCAWLAHSSGVS